MQMNSIDRMASDHPQPRWQAVGLLRHIPNPGDYITATVENEPVVVLKNPEGEIRALSRVCRHRGFDMLEGVGVIGSDLNAQSGSVKRLSCPYHAWTYNLDGQLIGAPAADSIPDFDKRCVALPRFDVTEFAGVLFVCLDYPAPDLLTQLEAENTSALEIHNLFESSNGEGARL